MRVTRTVGKVATAIVVAGRMYRIYTALSPIVFTLATS